MSDATRLSLNQKARRHLARRDSVLKALIAKVGACTLDPGGDAFALLVRAIVSQMISTVAARSISARIEAAAGPAGISPATMAALGEQRLREQGLSGAKARAILDLASRSQDGSLPLGDLPVLTDEQIMAHLTAVRGIGVWTAEMFLIFGLGRTDVLPVGDLGLRPECRTNTPWKRCPARPSCAAWRSRGGPIAASRRGICGAAAGSCRSRSDGFPVPCLLAVSRALRLAAIPLHEGQKGPIPRRKSLFHGRRDHPFELRATVLRLAAFRRNALAARRGRRAFLRNAAKRPRVSVATGALASRYWKDLSPAPIVGRWRLNRPLERGKLHEGAVAAARVPGNVKRTGSDRDRL